MKNKILVLCGSIRAKLDNKDIIVELVCNSKNLDDFIDKVRDIRESLSNSEILAAVAMLGALRQGVDVTYFPLIHLFPPQDENIYKLQMNEQTESITTMNTLMIKPVAFEEMVSALNDSSGVILSTPVYFGDRSSVANKFLQIASVKKLLKNKVFGMVSVGAKRNGGQETANIFGLFEALNQNALAVGNGPPTCQYGGTAVGGNKGNVLDDKWGLETAKCTGIRVAQVAEMIVAGSAACNFEKIKITILSTMDTKQKILRKFLDKTIAKIEKQLPWVEFSIVELIDLTIYRCLGCSVCPLDKKKPGKKAYCIIKDPDDSMEMVREKLNRSDAVVLAGLNILDSEKLIFRYQVFMERMRFIRRNDFELSNLLFTGLCYHQVGATINPIHNLKTITSYIRHNTIVHKHIDVFEYNGQIIESGFNQLLEFCHTANLIKAGRKKVPLSRPVYDPYGQSSGYLKSL